MNRPRVPSFALHWAGALRDGRARNAFLRELERTLRMFELLTPGRGETTGIATARRERHEAAPKAVLALR